METKLKDRLIGKAALGALISILVILPSYSTAKSKKEPIVRGALVTKVYTASECTSGAGPESISAVLAGLFLKPAVEALIKGTGDAIRKAGEDKVKTVEALNPTHFYSISPGVGGQGETALGLNVGCITIVHGRLSGGSDAQQKAETARFTKQIKNLPTGKEKIFLSPGDAGAINNEFSDDIRFFAELRVVVSSDNTAMRLIPQRLLRGNSIDSRIKNKKNSQFVVTIQYKTPKQSANDDAFAIATLNLGTINANSYKDSGELENFITSWLPLAPMPTAVEKRISDNAKRRLDKQTFEETSNSLATEIASGNLTKDDLAKAQKMKAAADSGIAKLNTSLALDKKALKHASPVTIKVSVTQTLKGNEFLKKLGSYIAENNSTIAAPIVNRLDPNTRAAAKVAAADEDDTLRVAALTAIEAYNTENAKTGNDRSELNIRIKRIGASQACRKLRTAGFDDVTCLEF